MFQLIINLFRKTPPNNGTNFYGIYKRGITEARNLRHYLNCECLIESDPYLTQEQRMRLKAFLKITAVKKGIKGANVVIVGG